MISHFASVLFQRVFLLALSDFMRREFLDQNKSSHRWDRYAQTPGTAAILLFGAGVAGFGTKPKKHYRTGALSAVCQRPNEGVQLPGVVVTHIPHEASMRVALKPVRFRVDRTGRSSKKA